MFTGWQLVENVGEIDSPALLFYPDRIRENIRRMVRMAGGTERLRPHIKTHKSPDILRLQLEAGITKIKCATIAEAEMAAEAGAQDILLAYQPVGPRVRRFAKLVETYGLTTRFSCIVDDEIAIRELAASATEITGPFCTLLDIDCGQGRTGVAPGPRAVELYRLISSLPGLEADGLQLYDGHIKDVDPAVRKKNCDAAFAPVEALRRALIEGGMKVPTVVAGGTPSFPIHASRGDVECSPGTCVLWDAGYMDHFPDLDFLVAALVLTRVVSKPASGKLCLDLGHKAIASEGPHPRVIFPELAECTAVAHNEEHLVIETARADDYKVGDVLYGIPWHICPTVNLYNEATVVKDGRAQERWKITGRDRRIEI